MKDKKKRMRASEAHAHGLGEQLELDELASNASKGSRKTKRAAKVVEEDEEEDKSENLLEKRISRKIMKQAREQREEIEYEAVKERYGDASLLVPVGKKGKKTLSGAGVHGISFDDGSEDEDEDDDMYQHDGYEDGAGVTEEDERAMAAFAANLGGDAMPTRTLSEMIMDKIREKQSEVGLGTGADDADLVPHDLDPKVIEVYQGVGTLLKRYTAGKVPKAFKILPALSNWEEVMYLTKPEEWSPGAVFVATRLFASNLNAKMAQRFYNLVLLPRMRSDIAEHKRLHFALYQALKKSVYKPAAFFKGILLPLCAAGDCTLREAVILSSVIQKVSIPVLHASVAALKIAQMPYSGTNSFFLRVLMDKKYAFPYKVIDALVEHFVRFEGDERELPVVWHQALLTLVQRYKHDLRPEDKENLRHLLRKHNHYQITPEVRRELQHGSSRGQPRESEDVVMGNSQGAAGKGTTGRRAVEEDIHDMPDVSQLMDDED
eukprot:jgi/Mesvir1/19292/Mv10366-RA.1